MSKIVGKSKAKVEFTISIELQISEAEALLAITSYGSKEFLNFFYEKMGKSYLQPHEQGLIQLFESVRSELPNEINKIHSANNAIVEALKQL